MKIFIQKLSRLKNSKFYGHKMSYPLYGITDNICMKIVWLYLYILPYDHSTLTCLPAAFPLAFFAVGGVLFTNGLFESEAYIAIEFSLA